jgi:hypothetical protein
MNGYANNCVKADLAKRKRIKISLESVFSGGNIARNGDQTETNGGDGYVTARSGAGKAVYYDDVSEKLRIDTPEQAKRTEFRFNSELTELLSIVKNAERKRDREIGLSHEPSGGARVEPL